MTGVHDQWLLEKDSFHEIDQAALFKPITKWSYVVTQADMIPEIVHKAFKIALSGQPGPVHLGFPRDLFPQEIDFAYPVAKHLRALNVPACEPELLEEMINLLKQAKYPVILAGNDILWCRAAEELKEFAELQSIPVTTTWDHIDAFPTTHPLGMGPIGRNRSEAANFLLAKADLLLALGTRFDYQSTRFNYQFISRKSKIIQVTLDAEEIGRIYPVDLGLFSDVKFVLRELLKRLKSSQSKMANRWKPAQLKGIKEDWLACRSAAMNLSNQPIFPQAIVKTLREVLDPSAIIVIDGGNYAKHVRRHFDTYEADTFYYTDNIGSVGSAFPMALGIKLACPERQVVCLIGDGGFLFNSQELETAVRERIEVCTIVFNDFGYGNVRAYQQKKFGGRYCCDFANPDFGELAGLYKAHGAQVAELRQLEPAVRKAMKSGKPSVIDVVMSGEELSTPGFM